MFSIKEFIQSYRIQQSKTGFDVPIVNDIPLHCLEDPLKEAQNLIFGHEKQLKNNSSVLVLGNGFGHHIKVLQQILAKNHKNSYRVAVIDPYKDLFDDFLKRHPSSQNTKRLSYYIHDDVDTLYKTEKMAYFLQKGPAIILHPTSFKLYNDFFNQFMSYKAPAFIHEYMDQIHNAQLKQHFSSTLSDRPTTLFQYTQRLEKPTRMLKKYDYLLLALTAMQKNTKQNEEYINN